MEFFHKLVVYGQVPREHQAATVGKIIGVRWADDNNGDALDVNYRSRDMSSTSDAVAAAAIS